MKFRTQHTRPKGKTFKVHRDSNVTWLTTGEKNAVTEVITHPTVAKAKEYILTMSR